MPPMPTLRILVLLPADTTLSTLGAAQLCKETAASITKGLKKGALWNLGCPVSVDCVDNPIDALVRIQSTDYNVLVVPVSMPEHCMDLLDYIEIIRDLENPIAIYYYRDALAEFSQAERQAKYLEKNRELLESFTQMYLVQKYESVQVQMVQGEVSDPSLPTATTKCRFLLGERIFQAIKKVKSKKELERSATRITIDDDDSNESSEPDEVNEPEDEAIIRSFRESAETWGRSSIVEPPLLTIETQEEARKEVVKNCEPGPSPKTMATIEQVHMDDVTSAGPTWLDNIESSEPLMTNQSLSEMWWDTVAEDIKIDKDSMRRLQLQQVQNDGTNKNRIPVKPKRRRKKMVSKPRKKSKSRRGRVVQIVQHDDDEE